MYSVIPGLYIDIDRNLREGTSRVSSGQPLRRTLNESVNLRWTHSCMSTQLTNSMTDLDIAYIGISARTAAVIEAATYKKI